RFLRSRSGTSSEEPIRDLTVGLVWRRRLRISLHTPTHVAEYSTIRRSCAGSFRHEARPFRQGDPAGAATRRAPAQQLARAESEPVGIGVPETGARARGIRAYRGLRGGAESAARRLSSECFREHHARPPG